MAKKKKIEIKKEEIIKKENDIILPENMSEDVLEKLLSKMADREKEIVAKAKIDKQSDTNIPTSNIQDNKKDITVKELIDKSNTIINDNKKNWPWGQVYKQNNDKIFSGIDETNNEYNILRCLNSVELDSRKKRFLAVLSETKEYNVSWSPYTTHDNNFIGVISSQIIFKKSIESRKSWAKIFSELNNYEGTKITGFVDILPTDMAYCYIICYEPEILHAIDTLIGKAIQKENTEYIKEYLNYDENKDTFSKNIFNN